MLREHLRRALIDQARTGSPTTYAELAKRLGLEPPQTIRRIAEALEVLNPWALSPPNLLNPNSDRRPFACRLSLFPPARGRV
jgi:hypothetical protein